MSRESTGDPMIERLLAAERDDPAPQASLARVWSRVSASVAPAAGLFAPLPPPPRTMSGAIRAHPVTAVSAALLVGAAIGASAVEWAPRRSFGGHPVTTVAAPSAAPLPTTTAPQTGEPAASAPPLAALTGPIHAGLVPAAPAASPGFHRSAAPSVSSLSEERALLDSARAALAGGDGVRALAITDTHQRRFVRPQLAEEREAIAIQALVVAGRFAEARARASRFQESTPDSLFAPAVEASLASIPR